MKIKRPIVTVSVAAFIGLGAGAVLEFVTLAAWLPVFLVLGAIVGGCAGGIVEAIRYDRSVTHIIQQDKSTGLAHLPAGTIEFIKLIIKKMRYRRQVRTDVMAELAAHFEDALKHCKTEEDREKTAEKLIAGFGDVKLLGVLLRRAKKRCRPLWRTVVARTFQTIGVLILCFVAYCVYISLGEPTISINYLEEATRLARPVVDESLNAAPLYQKAIDAYKEPPQIQVERDFPPHGSRRSKFKPKKQPEKIVETVDLLTAIGAKDSVGDLNEEELSLLQQWISSNVEAIEFFRQASDKPHCWWHRQAENNIVIVTPIPEIPAIIDLVKMIVWHAKLQAYNGDIEGALDDLLACYRAGDHFKGPRILIEQLVGMRMQNLAARSLFVILNTREPDHQLLKGLQARLEELTAESTYILDYKVERFFAWDFIQRCYTDDGQGSGHMIPGRVRQYIQMLDERTSGSEVLDYGLSLGAALASADRRDMSRAFEKIYRTGEQWAKKTPWQLRKEQADLDLGLHRWSRFKQARYWPVQILIPALARAGERAHQNKTATESLITVIAILRHKQLHGAYPENLERLLQADLLRELPKDLYSNRPLVYKHTADDFTLYSLGADFDDDGGLPSKWGEDRSGGDQVFWPVAK